jgi:hypothetical protein
MAIRSMFGHHLGGASASEFARGDDKSATDADREQDRQQDLADDDREQDRQQDLADEDAQPPDGVRGFVVQMLFGRSVN